MASLRCQEKGGMRDLKWEKMEVGMAFFSGHDRTF
jgi:hypothetical protein